MSTITRRRPLDDLEGPAPVPEPVSLRSSRRRDGRSWPTASSSSPPACPSSPPSGSCSRSSSPPSSSSARSASSSSSPGPRGRRASPTRATACCRSSPAPCGRPPSPSPSIPIGLGAAIYLSEYASPRTRKVLKPTLELLAGVPSVVYGLFAVTFVGPSCSTVARYRGRTFSRARRRARLGVMIIPTVASLAEDAMSAVPEVPA